jgi:hypothetical protein
MAAKMKEPLKSMRWNFGASLTVASGDREGSIRDDGRLRDDCLGDDGSKDEGTIAGR